jgi:plasmid stabilization system protein ParE
VSVEYAEEARLDLVSAITYLADRSPAAATDFAERLEEVVGRLSAREFHGPEAVLRSGDRVHSWPVYPFRIYTALSRLLLEHREKSSITPARATMAFIRSGQKCERPGSLRFPS